MENAISPLSSTDTFAFSCSPRVACFNDCCRDLNQFLTPYDVLRLKNRLAVPSHFFLERYTALHIGPETGLPVVSLRTPSGSHRRCPFVARRGCRVYEDRPSSCRMYPLARIASRCRETGRIRERYMLLKEAHCLGSAQNRVQTVTQWLDGQGLSIYNEMNDLLLDIISLKNTRQPEPLNRDQQELLRLALYDLDAFRDFLDHTENRKAGGVDPDEIPAGDDETELLRFAFRWTAQRLFN